MAQKRLIAGLSWSLGHLHSFEALTRVPTQVTCRIFKKHPGHGDPGGSLERGAKYKRLPPFVNPYFGPRFASLGAASQPAPINSRARSIAKVFGLSTQCHKIIFAAARCPQSGHKTAV